MSSRNTRTRVGGGVANEGGGLVEREGPYGMRWGGVSASGYAEEGRVGPRAFGTGRFSRSKTKPPFEPDNAVRFGNNAFSRPVVLASKVGIKTSTIIQYD